MHIGDADLNKGNVLFVSLSVRECVFSLMSPKGRNRSTFKTINQGGSLNQFIEFQHPGLNVVTISALGTAFFTLLQSWGTTKQYRTIRRLQSGKSIPMIFLAFMSAEFVAFGIYGFRQSSLAMTFNGICFLPTVLAYFAAGRYPDGDGKRLWHAVFILFIFGMLWVKNPQWVLGAMMVTICVVFTQSPIEIYRKKDAGAVDPRMVISYIAASVFWATYAWCIRDWVICGVNIYLGLVLIATLDLWRKYRFARFGKPKAFPLQDPVR
jgi:uncharacterized protein with PQ loop repeat